MAEGQFYFAWVDEANTTFLASYARLDEYFFSFTLTHNEGEFPTLELTIKNPRIGLLNSTRKQWAWLSQQVGTGVEALFFGRLVGLPSNIFAEKITLQFVAEPADYAAQRQTVADALKVLPFFDPVFVDEQSRDDPDAIIQGYSRRYHIDRTALTVTTSDVIAGEDGTEVFTAAEVIYASLDLRLANPPRTAVNVKGSVTWTQSDSGDVDLGTRWYVSFTGQSLLNDWPKVGATLGGGWTVKSAQVIDYYGLADAPVFRTRFTWRNLAQDHANGDTMSQDVSESKPLYLAASINYVLTEQSYGGLVDPSTGINLPARAESSTIYIPEWLLETSLALHYEASRKRTETIVFSLAADLQGVVTLPTEPASAVSDAPLQINGADVGVAIDGAIPIGDLRRKTYFPGDRGLDSVEYLLCRARAELLGGARIPISWDCPISKVRGLSCRKNATIYDGRLPGGKATGKVTGYKMIFDGGKVKGNITIGCPIGNGGSNTAVAGEPDYVEDDYVEDHYQATTGGTDLLSGSDVGYAPPIDGDVDDGLIFPLNKAQAVLVDTVHGTIEEQEALIFATLPAITLGAQLAAIPNPTMEEQQLAHLYANVSLSTVLADNAVWQEFQFAPVSGQSYQDDFALTVTDLKVPQGIDLAAASTA